MFRSERRDREHRIGEWRAVPLFAGCTRRQLHHLDGLGTCIDVRPGTTLTREGAAGRECFVVVTGAASAQRGETRLGMVQSGTVAGELALLDGTARTATVVAASPMRVLVLTPTEFTQLLALAPCIDERIQELAAQRRAALNLVGAR